MRFNIEDYGRKTCMHCPEEWMAEVFCQFLHEQGRKWCSGGLYIDRPEWHSNSSNTCYYFQTDQIGDTKFAEKHDYQILNFTDFDWSEEELNDELPDLCGLLDLMVQQPSQ